MVGPAAHLYAAIGDDYRSATAQDPTTLQGKILRIDVSISRPTAPATPTVGSRQLYLPLAAVGKPLGYRIPPSNPFTQTAGYRGEIWALGLRNPWRFSFDPITGDLYIADVGDARYEEINVQPASSRGGENYGWPTMEGMHCNVAACNPNEFVLPVHEYDHAGGRCAVIGGLTYRGARIPDLVGAYLFSDFCSGQLWALRRTGDRWEAEELLNTAPRTSSFGQDEAGDVYLMRFGAGLVFRLEPADEE